MHPKPPTNYLAGYPAALVAQVQQLIVQGKLAGLLLQRYPLAHGVRTDKALYAMCWRSRAPICATPGS